MKKIYSLLFIAVSFLGNAQNLVSNPTFADGLTGWAAGPGATYTAPTPVTNAGQDDSSSITYTNPTATTGFYQEIPVTAGSQLDISFYYKASGDGSDARIFSTYKDAKGTLINQTTDIGLDPLRTNNLYLPTAADWTQKTMTVTAPANVTTLVLAFRVYSGGTVSFDNLSVVQTTLKVKQDKIAGLNVYPNPVKNGNLFVTSNNSSSKNVELYDILGKKVLESKTENNLVNVSSLKGGVYIIKINEDGKTDTRRVIIQ